MSSKRQSMMPAAPPTPIDFVTDRTTPGAGGSVVIADAVAVVGTFPVTIHGDSVIHPRARLDARGGPVNIGRRCIVEERAVLGGGEGSVTLANYVSVETGATVEAGAILGEGSVIGPRCHVGSGAVVGKVGLLFRPLFLSLQCAVLLLTDSIARWPLAAESHLASDFQTSLSCTVLGRSGSGVTGVLALSTRGTSSRRARLRFYGS